MSVQTEISRLESAKQAIASAIANKGVTVPDGTMLDGMAALIDSIEAGGGGNSNLSLLGTGTFTGNDAYKYELTHGLGVTPKLVYVVTHYSKATKRLMDLVMIPHSTNLFDLIVVRATSSTATTTDLDKDYPVGDIGAWDDQKIMLSSENYSALFHSAVTYNWRAYA